MALVLSDLSTVGLIPEARARIVAGSGVDIYNPGAGHGSLAEGSLVIGQGAQQTPITALRRVASDTQIAVLDQGAIDVRAYLSSGGDGDDLSLYFQRADMTVHSFLIAPNVASGGGNVARVTMPSGAVRSAWMAIANGETFNFMTARPGPMRGADAESADASLESDRSFARVRASRHSAAAASGQWNAAARGTRRR